MKEAHEVLLKNIDDAECRISCERRGMKEEKVRLTDKAGKLLRGDARVS